MEIKGLSQGMLVANYKEMCKLLGEKHTDGNSKKYQLEEWGRYFNYEKLGNKFKITEVYDNPRPKLSKALYVKSIELLLMHELSNKDGYTCNYTKTNLFYILGMANQFYLRNNRSLVRDKISHIPNWQIDHFQLRCNKKLSEILFSALNSMKRRCLIEYYVQWIISEGEEYRVATDTEVELMLQAEKIVLDEMGYDKIPFLQIEEFYTNLNNKLNELYEWKFVYREIKIVYSRKYIPQDIKVVKSEIAAIVNKNKSTLNDKIIEAINKQAEYYYSKNCEEYKKVFQNIIDEGWGYEKLIDYDYRTKVPGIFNYPADYIEHQKELANIFLDIQ